MKTVILKVLSFIIPLFIIPLVFKLVIGFTSILFGYNIDPELGIAFSIVFSIIILIVSFIALFFEDRYLFDFIQ